MNYIEPKNGKKDELQRQIDAQEDMQKYDAGFSTTPEEQYLMQSAIPSADLTKWQQNLDPWLKKMVHRLRREVEVKQDVWKPMVIKYRVNGELKSSNMDPLCSDECIHNLVALLEPNTSPNVINSKFAEDQISKEMKMLETSVILDILVNERKTYNTPLSYLSEVKKIFRAFAMPTYYRALGGFESNNQKQIRTVKEFHNATGQVKDKKSLFSSVGV